MRRLRTFALPAFLMAALAGSSVRGCGGSGASAPENERAIIAQQLIQHLQMLQAYLSVANIPGRLHLVNRVIDSLVPIVFKLSQSQVLTHQEQAKLTMALARFIQFRSTVGDKFEKKAKHLHLIEGAMDHIETARKTMKPKRRRKN